MRLNAFKRYLAIEIILAAYLGGWNATVPLIIIGQGGIAELATYEFFLALAALVATPLLAVKVEHMDRVKALRIGCAAILVFSLFRYVYLSAAYSVAALIIIDVGAVCAFALVQPIFGVYPAEASDKGNAAEAYRVQRTFSTLMRVVGPLLAAAAISTFSLMQTLLGSALIAVGALVGASLLPEGIVHRMQGESAGLGGKIRGLALGLYMKGLLPEERFFSAANFLLGTMVASTLPLIVPQRITEVKLPDSTAGLALGAFSLGAIGGLTMVLPWLLKQSSMKITYVMLWALLLAALLYSTVANTRIEVVGTCAAIGCLNGCISLIGMGRRALAIPPGARVRLMAANIIVGQMASSVAFLIFGFVLNSGQMILAQGVYMALALSGIWMAFREKGVWGFLRLGEESLGDYYNKKYPDVYRRLFG